MKQRRTSYLMATDQRISNQGDYVPTDFIRTNNKNENYSYDIHHEQQQQKLRLIIFILLIFYF
jgi:hypothetical protein